MKVEYAKAILGFLLWALISVPDIGVARDTLSSYQWALQNDGSPFSLRIDDLTTLKRPGVKDEDLGNYEEATNPIIVAILDSGIDSSHPEFRSKIVPGGMNFSQGKENQDITDSDGHGTHVAGIIAASADGLGIQGVAQNARILPIKVIPDTTTDAMTSGSISLSIAKGIRLALKMRAQVINLSLGFPRKLARPEFFQAIAEAHAMGVLLVAAAGNDSTDEVIFPCSLVEVICVGAHSPDGEISSFSNRGTAVDILAPGIGILSTHPFGMSSLVFTSQKGFELRDGTSMAAPFVSGALANLLGRGFSPKEARARILAGARMISHKSENSIAGKLDLAQSQKIQPRSLILPKNRSPQKIYWNRKDMEIGFEFELVNDWLETSGVEVIMETKTSGLRLRKNSYEVTHWSSGEAKSFRSEFLIDDLLFDSRVQVLIKIKSFGIVLGEFQQSYDVVVPIKDIHGGEEFRSEVSANLKMNLMDFSSWIPLTGREFHHLAVKAAASSLQIHLIRTLPGQPIENLGYHQLDTSKLEMGQWNLNSAKWNSELSKLVLVLKMKTTRAGKGSPSAVLVLNSDLSVAQQIQMIPTEVTYFKEEHILVPVKDKIELFWYGIGTLPLSEKKGFNPWKKDEGERKDYRLYRLGASGLRSMSLPPGFTHLVSWIGQNMALLSKGENYDLDYAVAQIRQGAWTKPALLSSHQFHHLKGLLPSKHLSLSQPGEDSARSEKKSRPQSLVAFAGSASGNHFRGHHRISLVGENDFKSFEIRPKDEFDSIRDVAALFTEESTSRSFAFALTQYRIQFHQLESGRVSHIDQRRFSFLPEILALKAYFPLSLSWNGARLPALAIPVGFLLNESLEVITPVPTRNSEFELRRPAWYRLLPSEDCDGLPRTAEFSGSHWLQMRCKNEFRFLKL